MNYDLLFVESRRKGSAPDFSINPEQWQAPGSICRAVLSATIEKPFWLLLLLILAVKPLRPKSDLVFILFLFFCAVHILVPSLCGRYIYRYAWPMFVVSFIPFGIAIGRFFDSTWPLVLSSLSRMASLIVHMASKAVVAGPLTRLFTEGGNVSKLYFEIFDYGKILTLLLCGYIGLLTWSLKGIYRKKASPGRDIPTEKGNSS